MFYLHNERASEQPDILLFGIPHSFVIYKSRHAIVVLELEGRTVHIIFESIENFIHSMRTHRTRVLTLLNYLYIYQEEL